MGEFEKGDQKYKLPVIRYISAGDIIYNMINIINIAVKCIWKLLRVNPISSTHNKKIFFLYLGGNGV